MSEKPIILKQSFSFTERTIHAFIESIREFKADECIITKQKYVSRDMNVTVKYRVICYHVILKKSHQGSAF